MTGRVSKFCAGLCLVALSACDTPPSPPSSVTAVTPHVKPEQKPAAYRPSAESLALREHYKRVEIDLVGQGLLRQDGGGPDVPFTARQLTEDFVRIALYSEYVARAGVLVAEQTRGNLVKWVDPVRIELEFGPSVPEETRIRDRKLVANYARRLARITGHPISVVGSGGNFHVLMLDETERQAIAPKLRQMVPGIDAITLRGIEQMTRDTFCLVTALGEGKTTPFKKAVAVIRSEHPDRLRASCLHEEIAQGLGLSNDSPNARPSIFNDDEEFGLLTTHDEYLLKMLYDPRLTVGMTEEQARPIAAALATQLLGGDS